MISKTQLYREISQKWKIICFEDLHKISSNKTFVYRLFEQHWKKSFSPHDRLVLYSSHVPDLSLLAHIQQAASIIDISNNFITIYSPGDIRDNLETVRKCHSTDNVPIQHQTVLLEETPLLSQYFYVPDTICPLPWMNMEIDMQGKIRPCCVSQDQVADIEQRSLKEIFHGVEFDYLRQQMLEGNKPDTCKHCYDLEDHGLQSNRQWHLSAYKKKFRSQWIDWPKITSLDLKPGNTCNFTCRSCASKRSSSIAAENLRYAPDDRSRAELKNIIKKGRWLSEHDEFYDQLETLMPDIETIAITGGEPFLEKKINRLVKYAVEKGYSRNIKLHFNTNGSIWPDDMIDYWRHYQLVDISISIDDIEKRFETSRGGQWTIVKNNVKKFLEFNQYPNFDVYLCPTISILNVLYLNELINWATSIGSKIIFNYLDGPAHLNIDNLTAHARNTVMEKLDPTLHPEIPNILKRLQKAPLSDGYEFSKAMHRLDSRRQQRLDITHPEISACMGYNYIAFSENTL